MTLRDLLDGIRANWPLKLLSLAVAIALWFYVLGAEDPQTTQAIDVPVVAINKPKDLEVISIKPDTVELRLRGRQSAFRSGDANRVVMHADLRGAGVGENRVPLRVARLPYTLTALPGYPTTAIVELDKVIRRERPVQYIRRGKPASGFVVDSVTLEPDTVTVIGATSIVQRVARVVVVVDTSGLNTSMDFLAEVEARDHRDVVVNGVSFEPQRVRVSVKVHQVDVKTVPVRPVLGSPPAGWRVVAVRTDPLVVTVTGQRNLDEVTSVATVPIDISGLRGTKTYAVPLNLPEGISVLGAASVEVTVTTRGPGASGGTPEQPAASAGAGGQTPPEEENGGEATNETPAATEDEGEPGGETTTSEGVTTETPASDEERSETPQEPAPPGP